MRLPLLIAAAAIALAAGCGQETETAPPSTSAPASSGSASGGTPSGGATTTTTPANIGSSAEKKDGTNPVQQQVDPKESEQRRDFQQKGDAAGPTSPDTKAK